VFQPTRRALPLVIALGVGLLSACSDGGDGGAPASAATTSDHAGTEHSGSVTSSSAPSTSTSASSTAPESTPTPSAAAPAEARNVTATEGEMYIELSESSFSPGSYTIEVVNEGNATHDLVVERDGQDVAATETIAPGGSATLTVTLEAGEYVFYCSIANHRAMGMATDVTVSA
jgi:plastocyanin